MKNIYFLLFFIPALLIAQTPEQIRWMNAQPSPKLSSASVQEFKQSLYERKRRIDTYVKENNIPYIQKSEDGVVKAIYDVINGQPIYLETTNTRSSEYTRITQLQDNQLLNLNLSGEGYKVYIWDGGHARLTHQEFQNDDNQTKIKIGEGINEYDLDSHATHVTGSVAAKGKRFDVRGGAYQLDSIIAYDFFDATQEAFDLIGDGILTSNHSYGFSGSAIQDGNLSYFFGSYINRSRNWDVITFNDPYHLSITSAGNDGNANFNDDPLDPSQPEYDKLSGAKTSKNTLVVANGMNTVRSPKGDFISGEITSSSSQGPTDDLRVKPDITGIGFFILSTESANDQAYGPKSGTSMAAPNVSGAALLLQELYNKEIGNLARAASIKGLLLHAADDAGMQGPDAIYGWGFMNAENAAKLILNHKNSSVVEERNLNDTETYTLEIYSNGIDPLIASISWTDFPGEVKESLNDPTPDLVNDLDIKISQEGEEYFPWKLTGVNTNSKGVNDVDNFEKIEILEAEGTYTIEVSHKGNLELGSQNYTLIVSGVSPEPITCSAPLGLTTSNLNSTGVDIVWDNVADASNGYKYALMEPGKNPEDHAPLEEGILGFEVSELQLTGLSPNTNYDLFVKSNCGSTESLWNSVEFSTTCGTVTAFPFTENFHQNSGNCWLVTTTNQDSFWAYQIGISHSQGTTMPISGGRMATFSSENNGDEVGLISPYFENVEEMPLEIGFYFIQPSKAGAHNTTRILKQEGNDTPSEILHLAYAVNNWEEIKIPIGDNSSPFRIIIETTDEGGDFTAFDDFQVRFNGFIFNDLVWQPRNPQGVSTTDDDWWIKNQTASINQSSDANSVQIEENAKLEIGNILNVNGDITGQGNLYFIHDEYRLGQLDEVQATSQIEVNTTIERWLPAGTQERRAFRMISSAVTSNTSIFENWQENGDTPSGFGTHITGSTTGANGFDETLTGNPSLFIFNHSQANQSNGASWEAINNTDTETIEAGKAYRLFVRGDRNIDLTNANPKPTNTRVRTTGNLHYGDYSPVLAQGDGDFSFVGNPYPSIVNINSLLLSGDINLNHYYLWDPSKNERGAFVTVELPSGNSIQASEANQYIMPGQGFFIRNSLSVSTPPSITFTESAKKPNETATEVFSLSENPQLTIKLFKDLDQTSEEIDALKFEFNEAFSVELSNADADKLPNSDENFASIKANSLLSIQKTKLQLGEDKVHPLFINNKNQNNYKLVFENSNFEQNIKTYLIDHYLEETYDVSSVTEHHFEVDASIAESINPMRFSIYFDSESFDTESFEKQTINVYPNPVDELLNLRLPFEENEISVFIYDTLGKQVLQKVLNNSQINVSELNTGIYMLLVKTKEQTYTSKVIKK